MLLDIIKQFAAEGRSCFTASDLQPVTGSSFDALRLALGRLRKKGEIAMPQRGFYVILRPEYRALGCLPAEQFIPELMAHLGERYYVGLLSAAEYHGAAHHRPQVFQVIVTAPRRPILCGKVKVDFAVRKNLIDIPVLTRNTPTGMICYSSSEATAFDMVGYVKQCGGFDNVATVLSELAEKMKADKLLEVARLSPISCLQRLGYLLELVGAGELAQQLAQHIDVLNPVRVSLLPSQGSSGGEFDPRWRLYINTSVEVDT